MSPDESSVTDATVSWIDRVDPELRPPLEELVEMFPDGLYAIEDLAERRRIDAMLVAELVEEARAAQTCTTEVAGNPFGEMKAATSQ